MLTPALGCSYTPDCSTLYIFKAPDGHSSARPAYHAASQCAGPLTTSHQVNCHETCNREQSRGHRMSHRTLLRHQAPRTKDGKYYLLVSAYLKRNTSFCVFKQVTTPLHDGLTPATPVARTAQPGDSHGGCVSGDNVQLARVCAQYTSPYMHLLCQQGSAIAWHCTAFAWNVTITSFMCCDRWA